MKNPFGSVTQVGYVVNDIEEAMRHWLAIGVGPWFYRKQCPITEFSYRGTPSAFPEISIALANSGETQIELIEQRNDAPSLYKDMLDLNATGVQHIAYWTEDKFDDWCRHLQENGFVEGHAGRMGAQGRFAYYVNATAGAVIELSETTGGKGDRFKKIRDIARDWDGKDPVRDIGALTQLA